HVIMSLLCKGKFGISIAQVTQLPPAMSGKEGEDVTLNCKYETRDSNYVLSWYKQPSSGEMILLIRQEVYNKMNARINRYSVNFQKSDKSISLTISALQLGDSAIYFCALQEPTEGEVTEGDIQKHQSLA
uniref:Ig-like domain-containing protein n=1 Tax=Sarcophilus harrisii TaxID=9305 RepID=G3VIG2_SARHA